MSKIDLNKAKISLNLIVRYEYKRFFLKSIWLNTALPNYLRFKAYYFLSKMSKNTIFNHLKLRCHINTSTKSMLSFFKLSRFSFKFLFSYGYLNGLRKSSA